MTGRLRRFVGAALALAMLASAACAPSAGRLPRHPDVDLLEGSWAAYKAHFITAEGRVVRPESGGDTVSEGQAYAMLRAVWMHDRATFDRVWSWTRTHLGRSGRSLSALMAWHWGSDPDGGGHVIDWNAAPDADTDMALAMLLAAGVWPGRDGVDRDRYLTDARAILTDLIALSVVDEDGVRVMTAGEWADQRDEGRGLVLNPSYFAPAAYRHFARITGDRRWSELVRGSYTVLDTLCADARTAAGLPDFMRWTGTGKWSPEGDRTGWDAVRIPWRIGTDALWFGSAEATRVMTGCLTPAAQARLAAAEAMAAQPPQPRSDPDRSFHPELPQDDIGSPLNPLANAMWSFALAQPKERDRLLAQIRPVERETIVLGSRYYVDSLAYLPFLARAGRYVPPRTK